MNSLLKIIRHEFSLPNSIEINDKIQECRIFVPTHGNNRRQYCYYIDLKESYVICWEIDYHALISYMKNLLAKQKGFEQSAYNSAALDDILYERFTPHTARYYNGKIYVYPVSGNHILALNIYKNEYEFICDNPLLIYSATNGIAGGNIYYTRWNIIEAAMLKSKTEMLNLEFGKYDIEKKQFSLLKSIAGPDSIHDTNVSSDQKNVVAVEMPRFLNEPFKDSNNNTVEHLRKVQKAGICTSSIFSLNTHDNVVHNIKVPKSPAHIVFDKLNSDIVYIAHSNLWLKYCFGPAVISKYLLSDGIHLLASYTSDDFYRIPAHETHMYNNVQYISFTVFANQIHILRANDLSLYKKIFLGAADIVPDFSNGPYQYPDRDRTPYTLHPIHNSPYIILVSLWGINIINFITEEKSPRICFNINKAPVKSMGHSLFISDQKVDAEKGN